MNAKTHITLLTELLRDVDLEARMMTIIKAEEIISEPENIDINLEAIRSDLEIERQKLNKMLWMVENAMVG